MSGKVRFDKLGDREWLQSQIKEKTMRMIAKEIGCSYGGVAYAFRKFGIEVPERERYKVVVDKSAIGKAAYKKKYPNKRLGKLASNWKGGRRKLKKYWAIYKPDHPMASMEGYVLEHRLVMEKEIGRQLTTRDIIHHINGNGHDNRLKNLKLTTKKQHFQDHFDAVKEVEALSKENKRLKKLLEKNGISY